MKETKNEPAEYYVTRKFGLLTAVGLIPLYFLVTYMGDRGQARAMTTCVGMFIAAARSRWELRRYVWFWLTLIALAILHVPLFLFIRWTAEGPGMLFAPLWFLDFAVLYGCIKLAEKIWWDKHP